MGFSLGFGMGESSGKRRKILIFLLKILDLNSVMYFEIHDIFIFTIVCLYAEYNCFGRGRSLNSTSTVNAVDVGFIFPPSTTTLAAQPTHNNGIPRTRCPSPLMRDVGPITNAPSKRRSTAFTHTRPSPFEGCGQLIVARWRSRGERGTQGGTQ